MLKQTTNPDVMAIISFAKQRVMVLNTEKMLIRMTEPNWDYFINAPLDSGTIRFETKTERALHARLIAAESNWLQGQSIEKLIRWNNAKMDLDAFLEGRKQAKR